MTWLFFSVVSLVLTVSYGLISKKALSGEANLQPIPYASATFIYVGLVILIIYLFQGANPNDFHSLFQPQIFLVLCLNFVIYTLAPSFFYPALKKIPLSIVTIIYSLSGFLAFIIGVILRTSPFDSSRLIGSLFIISAVTLVSFKMKDIKRMKLLPKLFAATFFYSLAAVLDSVLLKSFSIFFYLSLTFGIPGLLLPLFNPHSIKNLKSLYTLRNYPYVIVYGFFASANFYFVFRAYLSGGSPAQVYSILALESVITVITAAIFLKERSHLLLKISAAILAGIGIYLLSL